MLFNEGIGFKPRKKKRTTMKRIALILGLVAIVGLSACGNTGEVSTQSGEYYSAEGRTAGTDSGMTSSKMMGKKKATRALNRSLRK